MDNESKLNEQLYDYRDLVTRIGDSVEEEIDGITGDGKIVKGFTCTHGDHIYLLFGAIDREFITIRYPVNIDHNIAFKLKLEEGNKITEKEAQQARNFLDEKLDEVDPDIRREVRTNLLSMLSYGHSAVTLDTNGLNIHGFKIDTKTFPKAPSFDIWEFEKSVQSTVGLGWLGKDYLGTAYGLLAVEPAEIEQQSLDEMLDAE